MSGSSFSLFETSIGSCGVAWNERGIVLLQLPEKSARLTRQRVLERLPNAVEVGPSRDVKRAIVGISALLDGKGGDLSHVVLDMERVPPFHKRVYELTRTIPAGQTLSYGEIATRLGSPGAARAVGQAMQKNPFAVIVPCHRVLAAGGKLGGFTANGGALTKKKMLAIEGIGAAEVRVSLFTSKREFPFDTKQAVAHLRERDPALGRLIERVGPFSMGLKDTPSIFTALSEAIVYQQLSGKAAATIYQRLCDLFPRASDGPTPANILRATDEALRGAGLSRAKVLALRDLAERVKKGSLPTLDDTAEMDEDSIIAALSAVRGVGRWTAEMLLMFRLGRPDVLPTDDLGIRKGFALTFGKRGAAEDLPSREEVAKRGERWKPYRTVASWYLWRAVELARREP
jgi:methylated-DNA-[protein]-cysteine S-methyltransferase